MNLQRSMYYILVVMMSVNAFSMMLNEAGIGPTGITPAFNLTAMEQNLDANATMESYSWTTLFYTDYIYSVLTYLGVIWGLVTGFPNLLISAGVPSFITRPLYVVWLLITFIAIIVARVGGGET